MPTVNGKHFAYTPRGRAAAKKAAANMKKGSMKMPGRKAGGMSIQPVGKVKKVR